MNRRRHATLQEVANLAGVSIATASRYINGITVAAESERRVRAAAEQLAYVPNEAARSLHNTGTMTIGLIAPTMAALSSALVEAIASEVAKAGYTLLVASALGDDKQYEVIARRLIERRVDATFCVQPPPLAPVIQRYMVAGVPILALLQRAVGEDHLPLIGVEFEKPTTLAFRQLHRLGHRRGLAIFRHGASDQSSQYLRAAANADIELSIETSGAPVTSPENLVRSIVEAPDAATFVVAPHNLALEIDAECARRGLAVPGDLSIVSVAAQPESVPRTRTLSCLDLDLWALGSHAGEAIIRWLQGQEPESHTSYDIVTWIEGQSVGMTRSLKRVSTGSAR